MVKITVVILAAMIAAAPMPPEQATATDHDTEPLTDLGEVRITEYCPACNEPYGYGSASGKTLAPGDAACGWLPLGAEIWIDGEPFTIVDTCGTDAIDIFKDTPDGCLCTLNEYRHVVMRGN